MLGDALLISQPAYWHKPTCQVELPTSRRSLDHVTDGLGQSDSISLGLRWQGQLRVLWSGGDPAQRMRGDPPFGSGRTFASLNKRPTGGANRLDCAQRLVQQGSTAASSPWQLQS